MHFRAFPGIQVWCRSVDQMSTRGAESQQGALTLMTTEPQSSEMQKKRLNVQFSTTCNREQGNRIKKIAECLVQRGSSAQQERASLSRSMGEPG